MDVLSRISVYPKPIPTFYVSMLFFVLSVAYLLYVLWGAKSESSLCSKQGSLGSDLGWFKFSVFMVIVGVFALYVTSLDKIYCVKVFDTEVSVDYSTYRDMEFILDNRKVDSISVTENEAKLIIHRIIEDYRDELDAKKVELLKELLK